MRITQILNDRAHWIFEAPEIPDWPPDPQGNPIVFRDITDKPEVQEGWLYADGIFTPPPEPEPETILPTIPPVTNEDVIQSNMYLIAINDIAALQSADAQATPMQAQARTFSLFDTTEKSPRYDFWRFSYFHNHANIFILDKLVEGGVLTRDEVDGMVADRIKEFGE